MESLLELLRIDASSLLDGTWHAILALLLWGLLAPPAPHAAETPWSWGDLVLAVLCGVGMAGLCGWWLAGFYLMTGPYLVSDFHDYCLTPYALADGDIAGLTRSRGMWPAAIPAALVARLGVVDSLAWGGVVGTGAIASGLYLWGRALHGRAAGISAALAMGFVPELVTFSRTLSFYPQITGGLALATGMAAVALRFPGWGTLLLGGMGVGLAFLIDLRGLIWGLACGGVVLLSCFQRSIGVSVGRLLLFSALILGAWTLGPTAYQPQMDPLEAHTDLRRRLQDNRVPVPRGFPEPDTAYVWGRSDPLEIPVTLIQLQRQSQAVPPALRDARGGRENRENRVEPWLPVGLGAALISLLGLLSGPARWRRALILVGLSLPWLASLQGAVEIQRSFPRFLGAAYPILALLLGLALATLGQIPSIWGRPGRAGALKPAGSIALVLILVLGILPSWLGPTATWKRPLIAANIQLQEAGAWLAGTAPPAGRPTQCLEALQRDAQAGHSWRGSLFGPVPLP